MNKPLTPEPTPPPIRGRRHAPSLFGPVILIAVGVYFLLNNLGLAPALNWVAVFRLWPLLLVFIGLNIIVRQVPGAVGAFLSALVGLAAVFIFGFVLLFADSVPILRQWSGPASGAVQRESVRYDEDVSAAEVRIDFSAAPATVSAGDGAVFDGEVTYLDSLTWNTSRRGDTGVILLETRDSPGFVFFLPNTWGSFSESDRWELALSRGVDFDLNLDVGSGAVDLDLSELTLSELTLDGGSGALDVRLPGGDYNANVDIGSGRAIIAFPASGSMNVDISGGSGRLKLYLPPSLPARLELDTASGGIDVSNRFDQVSGRGDEQIWQTDDYDDADERVLITIDLGSGSLEVR